ncbi:hypothetical protein HK100_001015 [Physocladia obscura]|uniref:DUF5110 domain-containing protein n=1 Tax=Physocladia obscura TaxID=109957 RepID=A0AAD5T015_9FUNG|nr:hypothetical protein HK100_001015 [Physocladia obscura]
MRHHSLFVLAANVVTALSTNNEFVLPRVKSAAKFNPVANSRSVIKPNEVSRFTILADRLIRFEFDEKGFFSDDPSLAVVNRYVDTPVTFTKKNTADGIFIVETSALRIVYSDFASNAPFTDHTLSVEFRDSSFPAWNLSLDVGDGNLHGTVRTLDQLYKAPNLDCRYETRTDQHCTFGLISRKGWTLINDTHTPRFEFDGQSSHPDFAWIQKENRNSASHQDFYFFGHGLNYKAALKDFTLISGKIPIPPRYALGSWSSRYWAFSDMEFLSLADKYEYNRIPLDVLVVDMDWHRDGWTGWSWNNLLFPAPKTYMKTVKELGIQTTLNLHPADGIGAHEDAYPELAKKLGYLNGETIPWQSTNITFMKEFFGTVIKSLESDGIEFFWLDWQQGENPEQWTKVPGLNPTIWLNYVFWKHSETAYPSRRPLNFHRWGGLGNHRYPIGFSGDTHPEWEMLDTEIAFTATASNVLFGYWSHDIGAHMDPCETELYTRWVQFGVWSPVFRSHSTKRGNNVRYFWKFPRPESDIMTAAVNSRIELLPYIYSMAKIAHDTGISLMRPLYYEYPAVDEAYQFESEYYFGDLFVIRPIAKPVSTGNKLAVNSMWVPPGDWLDLRSGKIIVGPTVYTGHYLLEDVPILLKSGAIVTKSETPKNKYFALAATIPRHIILEIFAGNTEFGTFRLFEDDGTTADYDNTENTLVTQISYHLVNSNRLKIIIHPRNGEFSNIFGSRQFTIVLLNTVAFNIFSINGKHLEIQSKFNSARFAAEAILPSFDVSQPLEIEINYHNDAQILNSLRGKVQRLLKAKEMLDDLFEIVTPRVYQKDYQGVLAALSNLQTALYADASDGGEAIFTHLKKVDEFYRVGVEQVKTIVQKGSGLNPILDILTLI